MVRVEQLSSEVACYKSSAAAIVDGHCWIWPGLVFLAKY